MKDKVLVGLFCLCLTSFVNGGGTKWVWGQTAPASPGGANIGNVGGLSQNPFTSVNPNSNSVSQLGNSGDSFGSSSSDKYYSQQQSSISSNIPSSPSRPNSIPQTPILQPSSGSNSNNNALPSDAIRQTQPRLIPGASDFISNALGGGGGGGGGNQIGFGTGILGTLVQNVPQVATAAINLILGRPGSNGNTNSANPLPINNNNNNNFNNNGGSNGIINSNRCKCGPLNQCFLPMRPSGSCDGGNVQCCQTSSNTKTIDDDFNQSSSDNTKSLREQQISTRVGLIEQIIRGGSQIFDDTLDLVLQPFLTQEDKQKLATRLGNTRINRG